MRPVPTALLRLTQLGCSAQPTRTQTAAIPSVRLRLLNISNAAASLSLMDGLASDNFLGHCRSFLVCASLASHYSRYSKYSRKRASRRPSRAFSPAPTLAGGG